jgi:hypothetical protein
MNDTDKLRIVIATLATIIFIIFAYTMVQPKDIDGLEGGNIERAIEQHQY